MTRTHKPLNRDRVLTAAARFADRNGLAKLSMRKLASRLGVEAMSLYNHVRDKDDILDSLVDTVIAEIELPARGNAWKSAMRRRAQSAREMFKRHPWAMSLMESRRNPGPASMRYYDAVLGCLRQAGFSIPMAGHVFSALDSYIYGFVLQEQKLPFKTSQELAVLGDEILKALPMEQFPYFHEFIVKYALQPEYDYGKEFEFGLDLILDAFETRR
ncbi:MAG: TetR/AcrR family transcriptional regulator [Planctomycetes bacterium]|nr:TetR/AcrR family transcriptional regulator [Planctomycetota bacterium]